MSFISIVTLSVLAGAPAEDSVEASSFAGLEESASLNCVFDPAQSTPTLDVRFGAIGASSVATQPAAEAHDHPAFGTEGSTRLNVFGGGAFDSVDHRQGLASVGFSYFFMEGISIDCEINGVYIDQAVENAWGGGFTLLFRWHAIRRPTWSIYGDGGAGMLFTSEDVPVETSSVNFTPQAGAGVSFDLGNDARMMIGARWYHISNANTAEVNPGRDTGLFYLGLSFPF